MPFPAPRRPALLAALAATTALAAGGCDAARVAPPTEPSLASPPPEGRRPPPMRLRVVSGDSQSAAVTSALPAPVVVRALDAAKRPVVARWVYFRLLNTTAGDVLSADSALTDAAGEARVHWTLGTLGGDRYLVAHLRTRLKNVIADTAVAIGRAGPPASVTVVAQPPVGGLGEPLVSRAGVDVQDAFGNRVHGATVAWSVTEGGGSLSRTATETSEHGDDGVLWTLGAPGPQTVRAQVGALAGTASLVLPSPAQLRLAGIAAPSSGRRPHTGALFLLDPESGRWHWVQPAETMGPEKSFLAWAPDGRAVAYVDYRYAFADITPEPELLGSSVNVTGYAPIVGGLTCACFVDEVVWSPSGTRIATTWGGRVRVGSEGPGTARDLGAGRWPQWSPDGTRVFFLSGTELRSIGVEGTGPATHLTGVYEARLSPGGERVAYIAGIGLLAGRLDGTAAPVVLEAGGFSQVRWSPDGSRVLSRRLNGTWALARADGSAFPTTIAVPAGSQFQDFSPDGATMVFLAGSPALPQILLVSVDGGVTTVTPPPGVHLPAPIQELRWRPVP